MRVMSRAFALTLLLALASTVPVAAEIPISAAAETATALPAAQAACVDHAAPALDQAAPALDLNTLPATAGVALASCVSCSSSAQCQPVCGGQVGIDFVCHYYEACGWGRFCLCFP